MRDFHDQKDLFKSIYELYGNKPENKIPPNWVDSHVFTMDFFLWFMAIHGYKLQKFTSRRFEQFDIHETIKEMMEKRRSNIKL